MLYQFVFSEHLTRVVVYVNVLKERLLVQCLKTLDKYQVRITTVACTIFRRITVWCTQSGVRWSHQQQSYNSQTYNSWMYNSQTYNSWMYNSEINNKCMYNSPLYNSHMYHSYMYNININNNWMYKSNLYKFQTYYKSDQQQWYVQHSDVQQFDVRKSDQQQLAVQSDIQQSYLQQLDLQQLDQPDTIHFKHEPICTKWVLVPVCRAPRHGAVPVSWREPLYDQWSAGVCRPARYPQSDLTQHWDVNTTAQLQPLFCHSWNLSVATKWNQ